MHVNCNAELQNNDFTLALSRRIPVYKLQFVEFSQKSLKDSVTVYGSKIQQISLEQQDCTRTLPVTVPHNRTIQCYENRTRL